MGGPAFRRDGRWRGRAPSRERVGDAGEHEQRDTDDPTMTTSVPTGRAVPASAEARVSLTVSWTSVRSRPGCKPKITIRVPSGTSVRTSIGVMSVRWSPSPFRKSDTSPNTTRPYMYSR